MPFQCQGLCQCLCHRQHKYHGHCQSAATGTAAAQRQAQHQVQLQARQQAQPQTQQHAQQALTVDMARIPCGLNGAVYSVAIDAKVQSLSKPKIVQVQ